MIGKVLAGPVTIHIRKQFKLAVILCQMVQIGCHTFVHRKISVQLRPQLPSTDRYSMDEVCRKR